ncbi:MAG: reprolysin-like metallopeptidase [Candidatus Kariarchaeaceae archaeon]|jgi:hypothetical protein
MRNNFNAIVILIYLVLVFSENIIAQNRSQNLWTDVKEELIISSGERFIIPNIYRTLQLDYEGLKTLLQSAPDEDLIPVYRSSFVVHLPMPDGEFARFKIVESPVMAEELASKFPNIRTYLGQGIDDKTASIRFDVTPLGFHAMVLSVHGSILIDPYGKGDTEYYISYYKKDYSPTGDALYFTCTVDGIDSQSAQELRNIVEQGFNLSTGEELRTYRLACAATAEYTNFHGGTVASGMAAIVVAINRVTGVYEREVAVRLELVTNNNLIVYTNQGTDPYTNNNGFTMLSQNQANLDAVIGSANYDIGHVFSTGGGGVAYLASVCINGIKARGVTGLSNPIGDVFYIDYVAHEMGHQFGGNHTFNGSSGNCSGGNRNGATAYEPGSGSTIQAYAGICSPQNIQNNSDDYFHNISYVEITNYTQLGGGSSCPVVTPTGNLAPIANAGTGGSTFPVGTPIKLDGSATDADGDPLTYNWEEFDLGPAGHPNSPSGNAPIFRSLPAVFETYRLLPKLSDLLNNTQTMGEILPTYSRTLSFRLTVRDNKAGGGGVDWDQVTYSVTDAAGPFLVTSPNTAVTWLGLSSQTITWDVANTNTAPVNVAEVNILLSTDGGVTWPFTLASNTSNDGSEIVNIPNEPTTEARIKIEPIGNLFFDISNIDFTIEFAVPVELTMFIATETKTGDNVELRWRTETEINNYGFYILRRAQDDEWDILGFVNGHGNSNSPKQYTFIDKYLVGGSFFQYKLKQIDNDGQYEYSDIVEVQVIPAEFALNQNYPNPFNPNTTIKYQLADESKVVIKVYDVLGGEVIELLNEKKEAGVYEVDFVAENIPSGTYIYNMITDNFVDSKKMLLVK